VEFVEEFRVTAAELVADSYVVTVAGEADVYSSPELGRELDKLCTHGAREIIVDLLDVPFIDSTVLGVLLTTTRRLRVVGGELVLVTDDPRILRAFEITGLVGQFRFDRSLASAVERSLERAYAA
jgi:anti-sigma B factor antagonist